MPIWVGALDHERLSHQSRPINILRLGDTELPKRDAG